MTLFLPVLVCVLACYLWATVSMAAPALAVDVRLHSLYVSLLMPAKTVNVHVTRKTRETGFRSCTSDHHPFLFRSG